MEIHLNRKVIIVAAALMAVLGGAAIVLWSQTEIASPSSLNGSVGMRDMPPWPTQSESISVNTPEQSSVAFAKSFYTVNYNDYDSWLSRLKAASTRDGYSILTKSIVPVVWPKIEIAKTVTPAEAVLAEDAGLVLSGDSQIGGVWQIRTVDIHIDSAHWWPTMKSGDFTALVMLAQQDHAWRFVSFMTPDQIEQIKQGQQP